MTDFSWHIIQVEPGREFDCADRARSIGVTVYCPFINVERACHFKAAGRDMVKVRRAAFPGYIFVMARGDWAGVFSVPFVRYAMTDIDGDIYAMPSAEIFRLRRSLSDHVRVGPIESRGVIGGASKIRLSPKFVNLAELQMAC